MINKRDEIEKNERKKKQHKNMKINERNNKDKG